MDVEIPKEYEGLISQAVHRGLFASRNEVLRAALDLLSKNYLDDQLVQAASDDDQWLSRFDAFVARHQPTGMPLDDSRDSIYQDR